MREASRHRSWIVAGALLIGVVATSGCSGSGSASSSPFCKKAVEVAQLGRSAEAIDDTDAAALQSAWSSYIERAEAAAAVTPSDLRAAYQTYASWLHALGDSLQRHEYRFGDAIGDQAFVAATDQDAVNSARGAVDAYVADTCKAGTAP